MIKTCKHCGKEFIAAWKSIAYCSKRCAHQAAYERKKTREDTQDQPITTTCAYCGKEFVVTKDHKRYCSSDCAMEANLKRRREAARNRKGTKRSARSGLRSVSLCWSCARVYNRSCSWTSKFVPVDGWTAQEGNTSYTVITCPMFKQDEKSAKIVPK